MMEKKTMKKRRQITMIKEWNIKGKEKKDNETKQ